METSAPLIPWLLSGDPAVAYQTRRDLLDEPASALCALRGEIARSGWGRALLDMRDPQTGMWGGGIYSPKWVSTHYTLLELKNLGLDPATPGYHEGVSLLLDNFWPDGKLPRGQRPVDLCVAGMVLGMGRYGRMDSPKLNALTDYILSHQFPDGGFNCRWDRGAVSSSLHTTLSVLEAFRDCELSGCGHSLDRVRAAIPPAREFILKKRLFRSVRTGEIIDAKMLMLSYPCRWYYDILRCLDYFAASQAPYDPRMDEALDLLLGKRRKNGRWPVQHKHVGRVYFDSEPTGADSRVNTLRALRVLWRYRPALYTQFTGL